MGPRIREDKGGEGGCGDRCYGGSEDGSPPTRGQGEGRAAAGVVATGVAKMGPRIREDKGRGGRLRGSLLRG